MGKNVIISTLPNISQNYLPKVNTSNIFANSLVYDNGTNVMVNTTATHADYTNARLVVNNTGNSYLEVRGNGGQGTIALTTSTSTTSNFPTVEIFNSADFGIVGYRPGVVSSNYIMYYELSSSTNRRLTFQTEGVTRLAIQGAGRILMGPTLPTDDGSTALQVNGGGKFSSSVTAGGIIYAGSDLRFGDTAGPNTAIIKWQGTGAAIPNSLGIFTWGDAKDIQIGGNNVYFRTEAGAERMRITSGGNVGIGVTPSAWVSTAKAIQLPSYASVSQEHNGSLNLMSSAYESSASTFVYADTGTYPVRINLNPNDGSIRFLNNASTSTAGSALTFSERMRITSGGLVGIGDTNIQSGLYIAKYGSNWDGDSQYTKPTGNIFLSMGYSVGNQDNWFGIRGNYGSSTGTANILLQANYRDVGSQAGHYITSKATGLGVADFEIGKLTTSGSISNPPTKVPQLYITSGGSILIGKTSVDWAVVGIQTENSNKSLGITADGVENNLFLRKNNATGTMIRFWYNSTEVGSISINTTNTAFNTSSDYRLKEDLQPINGLEKVLSIKTYNYKWKTSNERMDGVLAHELADILPYAVFGEKDGKNMQGVDYSKLTPILVKAIQEQQAQIEEQKADIESLKALINK